MNEDFEKYFGDIFSNKKESESESEKEPDFFENFDDIMSKHKKEAMHKAVEDGINYVSYIYKKAIENGLPQDLAEEFARMSFHALLF